MVFGSVSSPNVNVLFKMTSITLAHLDSVHDDVSDISDALVASQSLNEDPVTWCQVRLGQFAKRVGSIQDDVNIISDALVAAQSINNDSVTWYQVRLVRQMIGLNYVHGEFCSSTFTWCQVRLVRKMFVWILLRMTSLTLSMRF